MAVTTFFLGGMGGLVMYFFSLPMAVLQGRVVPNENWAFAYLEQLPGKEIRMGDPIRWNYGGSAQRGILFRWEDWVGRGSGGGGPGKRIGSFPIHLPLKKSRCSKSIRSFFLKA